METTEPRREKLPSGALIRGSADAGAQGRLPRDSSIIEGELEEKIRFLEQTQLATLNILEDLNAERDKLEVYQRATINILEDLDAEREKMVASQRATMNILEDFNSEKKRMEESQRATINILEDFNVENERAEQANLDLKARTEELKVSNSELERFAYVASHDLQEPLRMVASYVQLLERRYRDVLDGDAREFIGFAVDGANRMQVMIRDLLDYSRVGTAGQPFSRIESGAALERALKNLALSIAENEATVTHDPLPRIIGDFTQASQLFQNLVGNAIKFRRDEERPRIHVTARERGRNWVFSVADNGIGIERDHFDLIFIIFQRLHGYDKFGATGGSGIGLAICKRIVERHGGRIWLESKPGIGTTFYFTIPSVEGAEGE